MKPLNTYIKEKLIINKNYKRTYTYVPKSWNELRKIIEQRYKEQGPGTEQNPIDFNDIDVSKIDSFYNRTIGIFEGTKFEYIDISNWDVSNIKDMPYMFYECEQLISVGDLSNWDISNVKYINNMFDDCENLESVGDLSRWNVQRVKNMRSMFRYCSNLKSVGDLSKWNISNVEDMSSMFDNSGITNIPNWYKK